MEENILQIQKFVSACDGLVEGTFQTANEKIKDALRAVAESKELTNLFAAVTDGYDYAAAKRAFLVSGNGGLRGSAYLPSARNEILAFVFCLFVEIDGGVLHLNNLLRRYFYVDGSYTASYSVFADRMIRPFRDIVLDCYPACRRGQNPDRLQHREELLGKITELLYAESERVAALPLADTDRAAANLLMPALLSAAGKADVSALLALLAGYSYFLRAAGGEGGTSDSLFELAARLEAL